MQKVKKPRVIVKVDLELSLDRKDRVLPGKVTKMSSAHIMALMDRPYKIAPGGWIPTLIAWPVRTDGGQNIFLQCHCKVEATRGRKVLLKIDRFEFLRPGQNNPTTDHLPH